MGLHLKQIDQIELVQASMTMYIVMFDSSWLAGHMQWPTLAASFNMQVLISNNNVGMLGLWACSVVGVLVKEQRW